MVQTLANNWIQIVKHLWYFIILPVMKADLLWNGKWKWRHSPLGLFGSDRFEWMDGNQSSGSDSSNPHVFVAVFVVGCLLGLLRAAAVGNNLLFSVLCCLYKHISFSTESWSRPRMMVWCCCRTWQNSIGWWRRGGFARRSDVSADSREFDCNRVTDRWRANQKLRVCVCVCQSLTRWRLKTARTSLVCCAGLVCSPARWIPSKPDLIRCCLPGDL